MVEQSLDKRSVIGSNPIGFMRSHLKDRYKNQILPCGVIGNTHDFGSCILGVSFGEAVPTISIVAVRDSIVSK